MCYKFLFSIIYFKTFRHLVNIEEDRSFLAEQEPLWFPFDHLRQNHRFMGTGLVY